MKYKEIDAEVIYYLEKLTEKMSKRRLAKELGYAPEGRTINGILTQEKQKRISLHKFNELVRLAAANGVGRFNELERLL